MKAIQYTGYTALFFFLIVGVYIQFGTLTEVLKTGAWFTSFVSFVLLFGRGAFALFSIDLFRSKRWFAGVIGVCASLLIAVIEWRLIGNHSEIMPDKEAYLVFAHGFVLVSLLAEIMLSIYVSAPDPEVLPETKQEVQAEKKAEKPEAQKRKKRTVNRKTEPEIRREKLAEILRNGTGKTYKELGSDFGVGEKTISNDIKLLNGSI